MTDNSTIDDGGGAFACAASNGYQPGMSLRDWFAGQALVGLLSHPDYVSKHNIPEEAYRLADHMLKQRRNR